MSSTRLLLVALVLIGVSASPIRARALRPAPQCFPGELVVGTPGGDVPANWPLFSLTTMHVPANFDWSGVRLVRVADGSAAEGIAIPLFISNGVLGGDIRGGFLPTQPLIPGEDYDLQLPHCPGQPEATMRYSAIEPIAEPTALGTIEVSRQLYAANTSRGVANRVYFVEVTLTPDPTIMTEPWASTLTWEPQVDVQAHDQYRYGFSEFDFGIGARGRVVVRCDPATIAAGVSALPGPHVFRGAASVLGRGARFWTGDVSGSIDPCETAIRVDYATLEPLTPEEITFWDTEPPPSTGAASCSISPKRRGGFAGWTLGIFAVLALARARRRSPSFLVALVLVGGLLYPKTARATSPPIPCFPARLLAGPPAGDVPANWPLFSLTVSVHEWQYYDWTGVRLVRLSDGSSVAGTNVPSYGYLAVSPVLSRGGFVPSENLIPGEDYDFIQANCHGGSPTITRYHAIESIGEPSSLGTIEVLPQVYAANTQTGPEHRLYFVEVELTPDPMVAEEPWASSLFWGPQLQAPDSTYPAQGFGSEIARRGRVAVRCDASSTAPEGHVPGPHTFRGAAAVLGVSERFRTPDVAGIIGPCETAIRVDYWTLAPLTPWEMTWWDTGGSVAAADAGCSIAPGRRGHATGCVLGMITVLAMARARRRR